MALQPASAAAHNNLATALNELGRYREAAEACRKAIAANPRIAEAHHNLGSILQTLGQLDELIIDHDSVMLEACNSSFQVHLQVTPAEFPRFYNIAQVLAGPIMAVSANSASIESTDSVSVWP